MKIQIDTVKKTVKVEESVNLGQFIKGIKKMLPGWEQFTLDTSHIFGWTSPVMIPYDPYPWWRKEQPRYPWIIYGSTADGTSYMAEQEGITAKVAAGTYCLELSG